MPIRRTIVDIETLDTTLGDTVRIRVTPELTAADGRIVPGRSISAELRHDAPVGGG